MKPRTPNSSGARRRRPSRRRLGCVIVLKGYRTVILSDGRRTAVNTTGNPGMATGGSGDVLTGLITSLIGQGLESFEAAQLGVFCMGWPVTSRPQSLGQESLIARDLWNVCLLPFAQYRNTLRE